MTVVGLFPVLSQQVFAVVITVGGSHDCVNVLAHRDVRIQRDARLMIEFDEDYRTVYPILKYAVLVDAPHPGDVGF